MKTRLVLLSAALATLATASLAQQPAQPMTFRLSAGRNPASCSGLDAALSRPQTVTIANDVAILKSNGGINDKAKMTAPGVYKTKWSASGATLDIEVNTTASPATLLVTEPKLGCKWSGKAA